MLDRLSVGWIAKIRSLTESSRAESSHAPNRRNPVPRDVPAGARGSGIGDLGQAAYQFADWLADAEQWPLAGFGRWGPPGGLRPNRPIKVYSAFAGNPLLVGLETSIGR